MKIVLNRCYGGFGLSHEAMLRYAEIKGITLYPEQDRFFSRTYWTVPEEQRPAPITDWMTASQEERQAHNEAYGKNTIYPGDIGRTDPALIQVVEEMGEAANGPYSKLQVVEIPDGVDWILDEYDGIETVEERHRSWP